MKLYTVAFILLISFQANAQQPLTNDQQRHKSAGDILVVALPSLVLGSTFIFKDGQQGAYQFSKSLVGTLVLSYGLKFAINKERPNGENNYSFPSAHTSVAFSSAGFIQRRYGWEFGIPAYAIAGYIAYTRIEANKHDGWDVIAGAVIGTGMSYLFTKPFDKNKKFQLTSGFIDNTPTLGFTYKF